MNNWTTLFSDLYFYSLFDFIQPYTIEDKDNNSYHVVRINNQLCIIENLKVTHYADGAVIQNLTLAADWLNDGTVAHVGAYCWYNNNIANKPIYGGLYNQFSILNAHGLVYFTKGGVLQTGWRVPNKSIDIDNLVAFLGGNAVAGGKLKEAGILHWTAPNNGASNDVSFYGFGGGRRDVFGTFENFNTTGDFWSSEEYLPSPGNYWDLALQNVTTIAGQSTLAGGYGMSIRCVKDI